MEFNEAVKIILEHEGNYSNYSFDPGGETNFGISKRAYPHLDIKNLTKKDAIEIYRKDYWDKCHCDLMPPKVRLMVFDCAVNQGVSRAIRILQWAVSTSVDGVIGENTLTAIKLIDPDKLVHKIAMRRHLEYSKLPTFSKFGAGWTGRLLSVAMRSFCMDAH